MQKKLAIKHPYTLVYKLLQNVSAQCGATYPNNSTKTAL